MLPTVALASLLVCAYSADSVDTTGRAIQSSTSEKASRNKAQQKLDSQLLHELYRARGEARAKGVPPGKTGVDIDENGRALVDVRAPVTKDLLRRITRLGGQVMSTSAEHLSIVARVPVRELERLARYTDVKSIVPAATARTGH